MARRNLVVLGIALAVGLGVRAAAQDTARPPMEMPKPPAARPVEEEPPAITHHEISLNGQPLKYTATTGMLPLRNEQTNAIEGNIFYVAYTRDGQNASTRPLTFAFNGGPGSSTVWLHLGAWGPKRVALKPDGSAPPPPYKYEDNPYTLLDQTDLVFIDPIGTGFSRATKPELGSRFWGVDEDVRAVGEFIRLYLVRNQRWGSPKFLAGESYGTTRAAHLSGWLADEGIALNGIALISSVLNFQTLTQSSSNDLGYVLFLPSYTATAWYHKKLPAELQAQPLEAVLKTAQKWADTEYLVALQQGNRLVGPQREKAVEQMSKLTGLSKSFIENNNLRVPLGRFNQELLRDERRSLARFDSRFSAYTPDPASDRAGQDPSEAMLRNVFTPVMNDYVQRELNYKNEKIYYILGGGIGPWNWTSGGGRGGGFPGFTDVTPSLERAFLKNSAMKLYVAEGYYDMATPYWTVEYTLAHLNVSPEARKNIRTSTFAAGHMMYIDDPSAKRLRADLDQLYREAVQ